jgi:hypothetical protein
MPPTPRSISRHPTKGEVMAGLKGGKSFENLKEAFAGEAQANRRYLYFARVADIEDFPDIAGLFKDTADAETGHAFGHLDFLKEVGDPATGEPIGKTEKNLKAAPGHSDEERGKLSAVHFVRFAVPPGARARFATSAVALVVDHPNERARTVLSDETKRSLLDDLA